MRFTVAIFLFISMAFGALGDITGTNPPLGSCLCLCVGCSVNLRDAGCGNVLATESNQCYVYEANKVTCDLSGVTYEYFSVEYGSGSAWIAGEFLTLEDSSRCEPAPPASCDGLTVVTRAEWGARDPAYTIPALPNKPVPYGFVHHTVTARCYTQEECSAQMRSVQNFHMDSNGWPDIAYNFLVGDDGRAYEGRGWDKEGTHTAGYNDIGVAVCAIGDFTSQVPSQTAQDNIRKLFDCAIGEGVLSSNYGLYGHRDVSATACPGDSLYPIVQTWPEYGRTPLAASDSTPRG